MKSELAKLGLAACFVLTIAGCHTLKHSQARTDATAHWNQVRAQVKQSLAKQQFQSGAHEDAIVSISEAIALQPQQAESYVILAQANLEMNRPASAQAALDAAIRNGITSPEITYTSGVIHELRGNLDQASIAYAKARALDGNNLDFLVAEAECLVTLDRPEEALRLLDEHGDRLDNDGTIPTLTAHIAALMGNPRRAADGYQQAMIAQSGAGSGPPQSINRHDRNNTGSTGRKTGSVVVATEYARVLMDRKQYGEALDVLSPLLPPTTPAGEGGAVRRAIAACQLALGDTDAAMQVIQPYARTNPNDSMAQLLVAKAAVNQNDIVTALQAIDLVEQHEPDRLELWFVRATVNWRRGHLAEAAAELYDLLQNAPDDLDACCLLAEVLTEQKRYKAARTQFERALEIDPNCAWASQGLKELKRADVPKRTTPRMTSAKVRRT